MTAFRSVGARLSAALLLVLLGAFGIAYLIIVPSFERALVDAKVAALAGNAFGVGRALSIQSPAEWQSIVDSASVSSSARVVIFSNVGGVLQNVADSIPAQPVDLTDDPVALRAAASGGSTQGTVRRGEERYAEAAVPVGTSGAVVLLSASLHDTLATVDLAQHRLLVAAVIALVFSLLLGYGGAQFFSRRLRRLERAADRIAGGHFDRPVVDAAPDEIGQLARAFERMRLRLAQLDRARSEFIANASHELRTPLFSLGGFLELLADEELDEATRRDFVEQMRVQVDRLAKLATELLDLSRLDAGRISVERTPVDLAAAAEAVVSELRLRAQQGDHVLELDAGGRISALGDEQRVLQIARILVDNALLHTPAGTSVCVRVEHFGGTAVLAVEDTGPGIPEASARQVFERFTRLGGSVAAGSGLGLAIARELAELMGGRIELESRPGRTVFALVLSAAPAARPAEPSLSP